MSLADMNDANVPVVCFLHEPDRENGMWSWSAVNFMPRKEMCGSSWRLEADTKEEIMDALRKHVIPLYEASLENLKETGGNYYWERKQHNAKLCRRVGRRKATMNTETQSPHPVGSSAWFGADVVKPETFNSVIVWGLLENEYQLDSHEGFWCGRNWWSVRQNETDPMAKKKLSDVTHWTPRPQAPNAEVSESARKSPTT